MKFYIASRLENAAEVSRVAEALKAAGHEHTYDWTVHGSVQNEGEERLREVAEKERRGVLDADVVIVLLPGGRGTHAELGIALASGKFIFLCAHDNGAFMQDERTCAFYWCKNTIHYVGDTKKLIMKLKCSIAALEFPWELEALV